MTRHELDPNYIKPSAPASPVLGIVALALAVTGLCLMVPAIIIWFCSIFPFILGVAAIIVGFLGISRIKKDPSKYSGRGLAIAGILVGAVAVILPTLYAILNLGYLVYVFSK